MRRYLIAGNWKMNGSQTMTEQLISSVSNGLQAIEQSQQIDVAVCPPAPYFSVAKQALSDTKIALGAQNVNAQASGAFTGECSLAMLEEFACKYVLLGHSERRTYYHETDADITEKLVSSVESSVTPVLCVGETLEQRQQDITEQVIATQLSAVFEKVSADKLANIVVAYEPVWAIGTGETATPEQAQAVHQFIRQKIAEVAPQAADKVRILYGGSMKPDNAKELLSQPDIDGGLIGGAALQAESFVEICRAAASLN